MRQSSVPVQTDLFSNVPAPPALSSLQHCHEELVDLVSKLLWEVAQGQDAHVRGEKAHEQDQR